MAENFLSIKNSSKKIKVISIVVTYNGEDWVLRCINSLLDSKIHDHSVLVIDNGSNDTTVELIKSNFPSIQLILPNENLGFGKANNIGICEAIKKNADFVFLLNQDAWVQEETINILIDTYQKNNIFGILSPIQLNVNGEYDSQFKKYYQHSLAINNNLRECNFVNAAGWLLTKKCINKVGGFSPLFFHYGEDSDYCNRVRFFKFKIGIVTSTSFIHDRGMRKFEIVSFKKQLNQSNVSATVTLANINKNLLLLLFYSYYLVVNHIFNFNKVELHINNWTILRGNILAQTKILEILKYRKLSKKGYAYLNL